MNISPKNTACGLKRFDRLLIALIFLLASFYSSAQQFVEKDATYYVKKGRAALQSYYQRANATTLRVNPDESIYDEEGGYFGVPEHPVIDSVAVDSVAAYLIVADSLSDDPMINFALCELYANALRIESLKQQFRIIKEEFGQQPDLPLQLAPFAANIRHRTADTLAIEVYRELIRMFPDRGELYNDLAGELFLDGQMSEAMATADTAIHLLPEVPVFRTSLLIYGINEQDDRTLEIARMITDKEQTPEAPLIYCLQRALHNDPSWQEPLLREPVAPSSEATAQLVALLSDEHFRWEFDDYALLLDLPLGIVYQLYIHRIFYNRFPEQMAAGYHYAGTMAYYKRYQRANTLFFENSRYFDSDHVSASSYIYCYGWSLYAAGNYADAEKQWLKLLGNDDYRLHTAASYFLAKIYLSEGKREKAKGTLTGAKEYFHKSKYGLLAMNLYNNEF